MIKILHTADIHLDSPLKSLALRDETLRDTVITATRTAFERIVETAISEQVSAVLISGDLFDGKERSARTAAFLTAQMDRLRSADIRVFYIKGNHDAENPVTGTLDLPDNVHVFDARGGKIQLDENLWIHGVSFADKHAPDSLLPRFDSPKQGAVNIAMLHSSLAGAPGHDPYAPCSVSDLTGMGFDYWALGHVHQRQVHSEAPWVVMPGMPQGRDIGEAGPKSASLLSIEDGTIEVTEVQTSAVEFSHSHLDITNTDTDDSLRALLRTHIQSLANALKAPAGVIRLTLTGQPARHWQILRDQEFWDVQTAEMARETGCLWRDKLRFDLAAPEHTDTAGLATNELADVMTAIRAEDGFLAAAQADMDEVFADLPTSVRARLLPDEATARALKDSLSEEGARRVLAMMKGAEL